MNAAQWAQFCLTPAAFRVQSKHRVLVAGEGHVGEPSQRSQSIYLTHEAFLFSARLFCFVQVCRYSPKCVFDVGCGFYAPLLRDLQRARRAIPYIGIDSRDGKWASTQGSQKVTTSLGTKRIFKSKTAPCIVACEFLEHLNKQMSHRVLRELCAAVEPRGTLIITTPCADGSEPKDWVAEEKKSDHLYYWGWTQMRETLEKFGFVVQMWPARFLGDSRSLTALYRAVHERYGTTSGAFIRDLAARFGPLVVKSLFAHVLSFGGKATHMNIVARKSL